MTSHIGPETVAALTGLGAFGLAASVHAPLWVSVPFAVVVAAASFIRSITGQWVVVERRKMLSAAIGEKGDGGYQVCPDCSEPTTRFKAMRLLTECSVRYPGCDFQLRRVATKPNSQRSTAMNTTEQSAVQGNAIKAIEHAFRQTMHAIHVAVSAFGEDAEFSVLLSRLQEAGTTLKEAENQAVRIKSRLDPE